MNYRGMTWDHPRGLAALEEAATLFASRGELQIDWDSRSLEEFETQSIREIADTYDLVVLDHPHLGEAIREDSLLPLDEILSREFLDDLARNSVGPSFTSYQMNGKQWGIPLDAATQVSASLGQRLPEVPATWPEVVELAKREPVALSLSGPHALLTVASVCAAFGEIVGSSEDELVPKDTLLAVLDLLGEIASRAPVGAHTQNPISMLERMLSDGDISYVPLIYGYVNYSSPNLTFADAPTRVPGGPPGSIIGGTGLALTRRCKVDDNLVAHIEWLLSDEVQTRFVPVHHGQPSRRTAWLDPLVDAAGHCFYSNTLRTIEQSTVRPRYDGFIAFQTAGSAIIRSMLLDASEIVSGIERLQDAYRDSLPSHRRIA